MCSISGFICEDGRRVSGEDIIRSITNMHDRGNGLGGGFAAYGIYPDRQDLYAFHLMFDHAAAKEAADRVIGADFEVDIEEIIPTRKWPTITDAPTFVRYFVSPKTLRLEELELTEDDFVVDRVMHINAEIPGAFVVSSGKNMGAFKGVGYPEDVGRFFKIEEYEAWTWISHGRFPTNTPGWWGGAHPFTILDWAIVHNGEISSYGTNRRYLEMFGYKCTMMTDTEVTAYIFDFLLRRHKLPIEIASLAVASPFWTQIEHMDPEKAEMVKAIRQVYGSALINGPFAIILGHSGGMIGLNDRVKLRPLVAARKGETLYVASEEAGILEICDSPDAVWMPNAGQPVIGELKKVREKVAC